MAIPPYPFVFVRHGETIGNVRFICQGSTDYPLTEKGRAQGAQAGKILRAWHDRVKTPVALFSSDLPRAYDTATIISQHLDNIPIVVEPGLRERCFGALEGQTSQHIFDLEFREQADENYNDPQIAGLESQQTVRQRLADVLGTILSRRDGVLPVLVSHGRLFFVLSRMLGLPPEQQLGNAIPLMCHFQDQRWHADPSVF